jgi:hypothetical protein
MATRESVVLKAGRTGGASSQRPLGIVSEQRCRSRARLVGHDANLPVTRSSASVLQRFHVLLHDKFDDAAIPRPILIFSAVANV